LDIDFKKIGLKVGLEIHQQLATNKKLFCNCSQIEPKEYTGKFSRKLRISKSEMGDYDPAAIFEKSKSKTITYYTNPQSNCLVEEDEEPPHKLDESAKNIALIVASALHSNIFRELFPMRKIVIDGSNTTGFQRTMLISQGGSLQANERIVGVQSICLEEDAAKLLEDKGNVREYSLDRLGIPLIEIALEPVEAGPKDMRNIALSLGRLLRTTRKVVRGLGSIRQDVNVSIKGGGVVEVKGVQQLDQLEHVVAYEAKRQDGLMQIAKKLQEKQIGTAKKDDDIFDVTDILHNCKSKIIQKSLQNEFLVHAIRIKNFSGMFGFEPYDGIRLGKEIGQLVKSFGIGGVFHSDELPNYGIEQKDVDALKQFLQISDDDGFLIIAAESNKINFAIDAIVDRINIAKQSVPAETRLATPTGETIFLRPRPGSSRMYPETDIPTIPITEQELDTAKENIPKSWDEILSEFKTKYQLNPQLTEQLFDSSYMELFEKITIQNNNIMPNFIASTLCSTIINLERKGLKSELLKPEYILETFNLLSQEKIVKESIEIIFEDIMSNNSQTIQQAVKKLSISQVNSDELDEILDKVIKNNHDMIIKQKERAIGPLMGIAMKSLRGKVSGEVINKKLEGMIKQFLNSKNEK
jgi:glutamyl-tRNA(Gln) amidotransferase subunit E